MTNTSPDPASEIVAPTTMDEVDALMARLSQTAELVEQAAARRDVAIAAVQDLAAATIAPLEFEQAQLRKVIAAYLRQRRRSILSKRGRTVKLANGEIKWRVVPRSLDVPKDDKSVINFLLNLRGGKRYLRATYSVDKKALAAATPRLLTSLRHLGVWAGKHENLTIQARSEKKPTIVHHSRFPNRRYQ